MNKMVAIVNGEELEVAEYFGTRRVYDVDPAKSWMVADVLIKGAIVPISVTLDNLLIDGWEGDADALHAMMQVAEFESDFAKHPAAVAYMQEHEDEMDWKRQIEELRGGL